MENRALDLSGLKQVPYKWQAVVGMELLHSGCGYGTATFRFYEMWKIS